MRKVLAIVLGLSMAGCTAVGSMLDGMAGYAYIPPTDDPRWFTFGSIILPVVKDLIQLIMQFAPLLLP